LLFCVCYLFIVGWSKCSHFSCFFSCKKTKRYPTKSAKN